MKKIISLLFISCIVVSSAFSSGGATTSKTMGLSLSTLNNPFFVTLKEGAEQKALELGYTLIITDAQDDSSKQINDIDDLIGRKVQAILINPTDSDAVVSAIQAANNANIPVLTIDRGANGGVIASHIASDNVAGGEMAGKYLMKLVGAGAKVIELEGIPGASATRDRGAGFNNIASGRLDVVARQTANFNRAEGLTVTENILQGNKGVKGLFAHNDEMALGAVQALQAAGMNDVLVVGFDATDEAVQAVQNGSLAATVAQQPALIGSLGVETAHKVLLGMTVAEQIPVPLSIVEK